MWQAKLGEEERTALGLYRWLGSRVVQDLKLVPLVFEVFGLSLSRRDAVQLLERLELIHATRCPVSGKDVGLPDEE